MDAGLSKGAVSTRHSRLLSLLLALLILQPGLCPAHPFDGDGDGPARAGSSNVLLYLYLEPPVARVECLIWMPTALELCKLQPWAEMALPATAQRRIVAAARELAVSWCVLRINGVEARVSRSEVTALKGMPGRSEQPVPGETLAVMEAMLGLTWEFQMQEKVEQVELEWRGFGGEVTTVPVTVLFGVMVEQGMVLNAAMPSAVWKNGGRLPEAPPLAAVPSAEQWMPRRVPVAHLFLIGLLAIVLAWWWRKGQMIGRKGLVRTAVVLVLGAAGWWSLPASWTVEVRRAVPPPAKEEAEQIVSALLRNIYRAFDQSSEPMVYDVLERSVHGELLQKLYLQTVRALAVEGLEGTRVKVTDMAASVDQVLPQKEGFAAEVQWTALGVIGHWGHMHQRVNRYKAKLKISPVGNAWKLTGLEVLEEVRS